MLSVFEKTIFDLCITEFAQKIFKRMSEKEVSDKSYLPLLLLLLILVHFKEITTKGIYKVLSFILDPDGANRQIKLVSGFITMFHPLPDSYRLTLNIF